MQQVTDTKKGAMGSLHDMLIPSNKMTKLRTETFRLILPLFFQG